MRVEYYIISIIIIFFLVSSCSTDAGQEAIINAEKQILIDAKVKERITKFRDSKLNKCKKESLLKAESYVQEKLISELRMLRNDTLVFPDRPVRPPMPENLYLDTIGVEKIGDFKLERKQ